ncbi:MAG TPA: hypothetical protein VIL01_15555 [Thermomicrobiales bacterium]
MLDTGPLSEIPEISLFHQPAPSRIQRASDLALAYDTALNAAWRGEDAPAAFFVWLSAHRCTTIQRPAGPPDAVSPLGAGGRGIAWYDVPGAIVGIIPGLPWCYLIPIGAVPPEGD